MQSRSYKTPGEDEKRALEIVERVVSNLSDMYEDLYKALMLLDYNPAQGGETHEHYRLENARFHLNRAALYLAESDSGKSVLAGLEERIKQAEAEAKKEAGDAS